MDAQNKSAQQEHLVLEATAEAGKILLQNGAELFRVEETMARICRYYGVAPVNYYVLSNGIFISRDAADMPYAKVQHIPVEGARLDKVIAVNQLSREIIEGKYAVEELLPKLEEIRNLPHKRPLAQYAASGLAAACFCYMFGGMFGDVVAAFLAGFLLHIFMLNISSRHLSRIIGTTCGGMVLTIACLICYHLGLCSNLSFVIIGSTVPLVPGVAFTNGIRDIGDGNYLSGAVRLLDAILRFFCIAIGVGLVFSLYQSVVGGVLL